MLEKTTRSEELQNTYTLALSQKTTEKYGLDTIKELNYQVDEEGSEPADVAENFLKENKLI